MLRGLRTFLLLVEALAGFGPPALLLLAGLPLLGLAMRGPGLGNVDLGLGLVLLYAGGLLGIAGAIMLTARALRPRTPPQPAPLVLFLTCCGIASLAAALSWLGDLTVLVLLLALAVSLHFVHLAMVQRSPLTRAGVARDIGIALLVTAIPVGVTIRTLPRLEARAAASDPCLAVPGRNTGLRLHVDVDEAGWPAFAATMRDFGERQGLRFHDGRQSGEASNILYLSLCDDAEVQLMTNEQHYRIGPEWDWTVDDGVTVYVYARGPASGWQETADALERRLEATWPGRVTRTDRASGTD